MKTLLFSIIFGLALCFCARASEVVSQFDRWAKEADCSIQSIKSHDDASRVIEFLSVAKPICLKSEEKKYEWGIIENKWFNLEWRLYSEPKLLVSCDDLLKVIESGKKAAYENYARLNYSHKPRIYVGQFAVDMPDLKAEREAQAEASQKAMHESFARIDAAEHAAAWSAPRVITTTISEITPGTWKGISSDGTSYTINSYPDLGTVHVTAVH
jgi:hypothetical protein